MRVPITLPKQSLKPDAARDVHAEHREIFELAMTGQEARAALALEAHVRNTLDILHEAQRQGIDVFRRADADTASATVAAGAE